MKVRPDKVYESPVNSPVIPAIRDGKKQRKSKSDFHRQLRVLVSHSSYYM